MLSRILGGLLICLSCSLLGLYFGDKGARRAAVLLEFKRTLLMLKSEIKYATCPLPQAFKRISARTTAPFCNFYSQIGDKLNESSAAEAWETVLQDLRLAKEDFAITSGLGRALGSIDASAQASAIDMTILQLENAAARLGAENAKTARMYRGLGLAGGLLITVILL